MLLEQDRSQLAPVALRLELACKSMKVWFVNHYALPPDSAAGTRHFSLARELDHRGHQVTIVAASFDHFSRLQRIPRGARPVQSQLIDGVRFLWVATPGYSSNGINRFVNMLAFARRVRALPIANQSERPEVVVASSPHPFGALSALRIARKVGCPFVLEIRDLWPESLVHVAGMSPRSPVVLLVDRVIRHLYRTADAIVVLMPDGGEAIASRGGSRSRVTYIPNGIDLRMLPEPRPPQSSSRFTVMYAGAHGAPNAVGDIVDAAALLATEGRDDIRFRFVGEGAEKDSLRERANRKHLRDVSFEEAVPKERVFAVLQEADAFVATMAPSVLYRFGISFNKLFDYMAIGRPVILGNAAVNDIVAEAGAGYSVPAGDPRALADAIRRMADTDPAERAEMGRRGREHVEAFYSYSHLADLYENLLQRLEGHS